MIVKFSVPLCMVIILEIASAADIYDVYFGKPLTDRRRDYMITRNVTSVCTINFETCSTKEGRRVDGTCTNPKYPTRGATLTPFPRLLPAKYGPGNTIKPAMDGSDLPSARLIRTTLLPDGFVNDHPFTELATHYFAFSTVDSSALDDILKYAAVSDCCVGNVPNRVNPQCIAIPVPEEDPYLRLTGIRCMNLTRFTTFQDIGCIPNSLPAERVNRATPLLDLSPVYGNTAVAERRVRVNQDGLLKSEIRQNGNEYPPGNSPLCVNNRLPNEAQCYEYGDQFDGNVLLGTSIQTLWYYRQHNIFARKLKKINPCWDDQKLFETARAVNIAMHQHIFYYELVSEMIGKKNAYADGVIYDTKGYVNDFDSRYEPGVLTEYIQGTRWFHTFQDAFTDLYDSNGKYLGTRPTVEDELRSGILEVNNTEAELTLGSFRQKSAKFDFVMDPDLAERLFGNLQRASDLMAIDIKRGRDVGLQSYNEYRKICGLPVAKKFEDFEDKIDKGRVEKISRLYDDVDDMELMTAVYTEKWVHGGWVGPTLYCIMVKNLLLWRRADMYFYEHGEHHARLTIPQLNEIRKSSVARLLCDTGDEVKEIQSRAFYKISKENELKPCEQIPSIDLTKWKDSMCNKDNDEQPKNDKADEKHNEMKPNQLEYWNDHLVV